MSWVSVKVAAEKMSVDPSTMRKWIKDGRLPTRFVNKTKGPSGKRTTIRVNIDAYEKHIETRGILEQGKP